MTDYTRNNHLEYSIGGRKFGYRSNSVEKFKVTVGPIDPDIYRTSSWREELKKTADSVYKEFGQDLVVFLSGGTDSEIVLRNFLEIGIKPRCAVIKFENNYNEIDVSQAIDIAKELDVKLDILDFNVKDFYYSGEADEFGQELQCTQVTYLTVYKNILKYGAPAIMGGELLSQKKIEKNNSYWYYCFRENEDASAMRFSEKFNIPLVNEWFSYTPEMMLYWFEFPYIKKLFNNEFFYKLSSVSTKNYSLKMLYPEIIKKKKTHGFEKLLGFNFEAYRSLGRNQIKRVEPSLDGIEITKIIEMLRGKE